MPKGHYPRRSAGLKLDLLTAAYVLRRLKKELRHEGASNEVYELIRRLEARADRISEPVVLPGWVCRLNPTGRRKCSNDSTLPGGELSQNWSGHSDHSKMPSSSCDGHRSLERPREGRSGNGAEAVNEFYCRACDHLVPSIGYQCKAWDCPAFKAPAKEWQKNAKQIS